MKLTSLNTPNDVVKANNLVTSFLEQLTGSPVSSVKIVDICLSDQHCFQLEVCLTTDNRLDLFFENGIGTFIISVRLDDEGQPVMSFHRDVVRPNHDHNDGEYLVTKGNGKPFWNNRFPYKDPHGGYEMFDIPFGAKVVDY